MFLFQHLPIGRKRSVFNYFIFSSRVRDLIMRMITDLRSTNNSSSSDRAATGIDTAASLSCQNNNNNTKDFNNNNNNKRQSQQQQQQRRQLWTRPLFPCQPPTARTTSRPAAATRPPAWNDTPLPRQGWPLLSRQLSLPATKTAEAQRPIPARLDSRLKRLVLWNSPIT
jgi:hypothetical protein